MIPVSILPDRRRLGVSLAMYIFLKVLHRNTLDAMQGLESHLKGGTKSHDHCHAICMSMYYFAIFTIYVNFFFLLH